MITAVCQRWKERRGVYVPAGEVLNPRDYEVAAIPDDTTARAFVETEHYSGSYPAALRRFGLYTGEHLVGVAVFSEPMQKKALRPFPPDAAMDLGRFVLQDRVPGNGETWFLARCLHQLQREGVVGVVSFSDPVPRVAKGGEQVFRGHIGTIYQASGALYANRGTVRTLRVFDDGTVFNGRTASKARKGEKGRRYAIAQLVAKGAREPRAGEDIAAWLRGEVRRLTRPLRHRGNHRYLFPLDPAARRWLRGTGLPYPKGPIG